MFSELPPPSQSSANGLQTHSSREEPGLMIERFWIKVCWVGIFAYAAFHWFRICQTAVNIPYMDEWDIFFGSGKMEWSTDFLLRSYNEHQLLSSLVLALINLKLFRLNFAYQIIFNTFLYAGLVATVWFMIGTQREKRPSFLPLLALLPFISMLPYENHFFSIQNMIHISLGCLLVGSYLLFLKEGWRYFLAALFLWAVAVFSYAGMVLAVAVAVMVYVVWLMIAGGGRRWLKIAFVAGWLGLILFGWFHHFHKNPAHPAYSMPWSLSFLSYLSEVVSLGFGFTRVNAWTSGSCLGIVFVALLRGCDRLIRFRQPRDAFLFAMLLSIFTVLALTAFARAGFPVGQAKSSRYSEVSMFLPILSIAIFNIHSWGGRWFAMLTGLLLLFGLSDDFSLKGIEAIRESREKGLACVHGLMKSPEQNPQGLCPDLYPFPMLNQLNRAKDLGVSFTTPP